MMKRVDIVVIGQNYSTSLGIIQAAGEAGYGVGVVHSSIRPLKRFPLETRSKYVSKYIISDRCDERALLLSLISSFSCADRKIVLLPSDDYSVGVIDRNLSILETHFIVPNVRHLPGEMLRLMDKNVQSYLAIDANLSTAKSWRIDIKGTREIVVPEDVVYPCITKPLVSIGSPKTYIRECASRDELKSVLRDINQESSCSILVEELVSIDAEFTVPILSMGADVFIPVFLEKKKVGFGKHRGVTIAGKVVSSSRYPHVVEGMKRLIKKANLQGIFDVELFKCGDSFFFNELNLRYGAAGYALTRAGINMPALWIEYCRGNHPCIDNLSFKEGLTFVSDKAALECFGAGYMTWKDYRHIVTSADFRFLVDNPDIPVKLGFKRIELKTRFLNILR